MPDIPASGQPIPDQNQALPGDETFLISHRYMNASTHDSPDEPTAISID